VPVEPGKKASLRAITLKEGLVVGISIRDVADNSAVAAQPAVTCNSNRAVKRSTSFSHYTGSGNVALYGDCATA